jgi:hypothetical protein
MSDVGVVLSAIQSGDPEAPRSSCRRSAERLWKYTRAQLLERIKHAAQGDGRSQNRWRVSGGISHYLVETNCL